MSFGRNIWGNVAVDTKCRCLVIQLEKRYTSIIIIFTVYLLFYTFRGRLRHGRHFTYKSVLNDVAITLVSSSVVGSIADEHHPYAAHGPWLQVGNFNIQMKCLRQINIMWGEHPYCRKLYVHWITFTTRRFLCIKITAMLKSWVTASILQQLAVFFVSTCSL